MSPILHLTAFGQRIKTLRRERKWTQGQLAEALAKQGVSTTVSYLSKIENAHVEAVPSEDVIRGLAAVLLESADELLELAGRIDPRSLQAAISEQPAAAGLLRRIQNGDVTSEQLRRWLRETERNVRGSDADSAKR